MRHNTWAVFNPPRPSISRKQIPQPILCRHAYEKAKRKEAKAR